MSQYRIPVTGDKVIIDGLVSASQHNGKTATVVDYLPELADERYKVKLQEDRGDLKALSIKASNLTVVEEEKAQDDRTSTVNMHVLIPCHINNKRRALQFWECAKSVSMQGISSCRAFFSISGDDHIRTATMQMLRGIVHQLGEKCGLSWYVLDDGSESKAQFEHLKDLLDISAMVDPKAWLMFLDNDDMYHPRRVSVFRQAAVEHHLNPEFQAFYCGGKLILDSAKIGDEVVKLEAILNLDESLNGKVSVAATMEENSKLDVTEYFDWCVRSSVLKKFLDLTPTEMLRNNFCDVRFMATVGRLCTYGFSDPDQEWLLMHYRVSHYDRYKAFKDNDAERHSNAMMEVSVSEVDQELASKTTLEATQVAWCRKDIEEAAIQFVARDQTNLESARARVTEHMDEDFGHSIGTLLWKQTCDEFGSYFTEEMIEKNATWCKEGKAPYIVCSKETDGSLDNVY